MRILKVWILPCLTALVVLASAVLPQWLSRLGDQRLLGSVHTEEMAAENGLAFRTPDLLERLEMATAWSYDTGTLSVFTQEVSDESGELAEQVLAELRSLADSGVLPEELVLDETPNIQGLRIFLRDRETGLSTSFWCLDGKGTDMTLYIVLDVESGHAVRLDFSHPALRKYAPVPLLAGKGFLDRLGLEYEPYGYKREAAFVLTDTEITYLVFAEEDYLSIFPETSAQTDAAAEAFDDW